MPGLAPPKQRSIAYKTEYGARDRPADPYDPRYLRSLIEQPKDTELYMAQLEAEKN